MNKLWFSKNKVGLLDRNLPTLLILEPTIGREGYPTGKIDVRYGHAVIRSVDPNVLHDLVSAAKEMATLSPGLTVEQHARLKSGLPAEPPPAEHDGETDELFA